MKERRVIYPSSSSDIYASSLYYRPMKSVTASSLTGLRAEVLVYVSGISRPGRRGTFFEDWSEVTTFEGDRMTITIYCWVSTRRSEAKRKKMATYNFRLEDLKGLPV